jgi:oligoribonuclease NrnB/cAMP/cGMP phosphodiesterase (DHH superfamily)
MSLPKFSADKLRGVTDVYFHENCPDGSAAALICAAAFKAAGTRPKFRSLQYDTELMNKLEPRPGQLFVDITPPKARWGEWENVQPIVLDHHETAKVVTEGLGGVYATNEKHSGAMLALEEVFDPLVAGFDESLRTAWKNLAQLAMIRDTWKKESPLWRDACALAMALLFDGSKCLIEKAQEHGPNILLPGGHLFLDQYLGLGHKLLENNDRRVEKLAKSAYRETYSFDKEYEAAYFNCTEKIVSDVANFLIDNGCNLAVGYFFLFEDGANRCQVSLRTDGTLSARRIAERFPNGGGHERAAGFRLHEGDQMSPHKIYSVVSTTIVEMLNN